MIIVLLIVKRQSIPINIKVNIFQLKKTFYNIAAEADVRFTCGVIILLSAI